MSKAAYIVIGIITFLGVLLVMAPASLILTVAGDQLAGVPHLKTGEMTGTLWRGKGQFQYREFPPAGLDWRLSPWSLLFAELGLTGEVTADGLKFQTEADISADHTRLTNTSAMVEADFINQVTVQYGLDLSGEFELDEAALTLTGEWLTELEGTLNWNGGIVHIETPEQIHTVKLPPLTGQFSMAGDEALMRVTGSNEHLMDIAVNREGWARVEIMFRLIDLTGLTVPGDFSDPDEAAVILEEKIF